jgi:hypothetical protein
MAQKYGFKTRAKENFISIFNIMNTKNLRLLFHQK